MKIRIKRNGKDSVTVQTKIKVGKKHYPGAFVEVNQPIDEDELVDALLTSAAKAPFKPRVLQDWADKRGTE